jgi:hypothetical protein
MRSYSLITILMFNPYLNLVCLKRKEGYMNTQNPQENTKPQDQKDTGRPERKEDKSSNSPDSTTTSEEE